MNVSSRPTLAKPVLSDDPLWYKDAVIYQLHVKSFFDANNDGIGDFAGLSAKLDYIVSLGVNTIWLLPFFPSPRKDDGYDIADYRDVSPDYGQLSEFKAFVREAHARGLRVIIELVINHTSDQHPWFKRARAAKRGSAARDFYVWSESDQKFPETRIIFLDTEKSNWTWDPVAGAYFWHRFYSHQPDLNFDNPKVLKEVLSVMRFWLDMGVDGLRLDAIPYLIEREGTNNENLPETHDILKKIRADLDARFKNRMLLAEANQWPEDTQQYFGDSDECHMAFHFPLMPRMYMAIAKEDRFPITDIMRQTPSIPASCQWAIFLRNHDELTLEMVTDEERDYLWNTYAADRRARINLGIRRRLAPLLEHDRRRIELMNGLLLSMPGTPVIYYGDEIGMGDNIHLGDRDGVRTPMQWSEDRNGGFSRADPAAVILPPIMDPLYGFDAVNVEAQSRDRYSLLNWMRRMLLLRSEHQAFGRGTIQFLYPSNRRVLAYVREYEGKALLCVANLSRSPQAVELDLSAYAGMVPVEITGPSPFPPIGRLDYLLTLQPFSFYWFDLQPDTQDAGRRQTPPDMLPEFQTLVVRDSLQELLGETYTSTILRDILPDYLKRRRWFAGKNEKISSVRVAYTVPLSRDDGIFLNEIEVRSANRTERYLLPAAIAWEDAATPALVQQLALAKVRRKRQVGFITDAFAFESLPRAMIKAMRDRLQIETPDGMLHFEGSELLDAIPEMSAAPIRWLSAEQSNSSLLIGSLAMLKLIRRIVAGIHPEAEMARYLTEAGYANSPKLLGELRRVGKDGVLHTMAIVEGHIDNQGDAWVWMIETLKRVIEDSVISGADDTNASLFAEVNVFSATVGKRLGEMHLLLSRPTDNPDFAPVVVDDAEIDIWAQSVGRQLTLALAEIEKVRDRLDAETAALGDKLKAGSKALVAAIPRLAEAGRGTLATRVHGDFHLGQILVSQGDAYIIDFEGEPIKSLADRRAKTTPLHDVAGFLRSLDYVAASIDRPENDASQQPVREKRSLLLKRSLSESSQAFLDAYWETIALGQDKATTSAQRDLLDLMLLEKASYEVMYEAANRPTWLATPLAGLTQLAIRLTSEKRDP